MQTLSPERIFHPIQRDYATFLATSRDTGGDRTVLEVELAPGGGNAPHVHPSFDERFELLAGTLAVHVDGETHLLNPGDRAIAPAGTRHNFANPSADEPAVFRVTLHPGSAGFEDALRIAYGLACDRRVNERGIPRNLYHLAVLMEMGETRPTGAASLLAPAFRLLARRARRLGIERELIERYVPAHRR